MEDIIKLIDRYLLSAALLIIGGGLLFYGLMDDQPGLFKAGGAGVLLMGVVSLLYTLGKINRIASMALGAFMMIGTVTYGYLDYNSVDGELELRAAKEVHQIHVVQRLKDIRAAEIGFKKRYGRYCSDLDSLVNFVKYDSVMIPITKGEVPTEFTQQMADFLEVELFDLITKGMNDSMAFRLAELDSSFIFVRDTFYLAAFPEIFKTDSMTLSMRKHELFIDSLPYQPFKGGKVRFILNASTLESGGQRVPVFEAMEGEPFDDKGDPLTVGSLSEPKTNGNWGE